MLGTVSKGDVVRLDVYLKESRFLFDGSVNDTAGAGVPRPVAPGAGDSPQAWWDFRYTFEPEHGEPYGAPESFGHAVTGGVNSLVVSIDESRNARYYILEIVDRKEASAVPRTVTVTAEELYTDREGGLPDQQDARQQRFRSRCDQSIGIFGFRHRARR